MIAEAVWIIIGLIFVFVVGYNIGAARMENKLKSDSRKEEKA